MRTFLFFIFSLFISSSGATQPLNKGRVTLLSGEVKYDSLAEKIVDAVRSTLSKYRKDSEGADIKLAHKHEFVKRVSWPANTDVILDGLYWIPVDTLIKPLTVLAVTLDVDEKEKGLKYEKSGNKYTVYRSGKRQGRLINDPFEDMKQPSGKAKHKSERERKKQKRKQKGKKKLR